MLQNLEALLFSLAILGFLVFGFPILLRQIVNSNPFLLITIWVLLLVGIMGLTGLVVFQSIVSVALAYNSYRQTSITFDNVLPVLVVSLLPWLLVGGLGIWAAILSQRIEPQLASSKKVDSLLMSVSKRIDTISGTPVIQLETNLPLAFCKKVDGKVSIYISTGLKDSLSDKQMHAVLAHEIAHIERKHLTILAIAKTLNGILPKLHTTKIALQSLKLNLELDADRIAGKKVNLTELETARAKILSCL